MQYDKRSDRLILQYHVLCVQYDKRSDRPILQYDVLRMQYSKRSDRLMLQYHVVVFVCSTIKGRIDQVHQVLELGREASGTARYGALEKWSQQLSQLHSAVINKMA